MSRYVFAYIIFLALVGCRSHSGAAGSVIDKFMKDGNVPGLCVAVVRDTLVVYQQNFGLADKEQARALTDTTCMELGSVSKAFTAELIYDLHQAGIISVNDPITRYLPDAPRSWSGITLKHLLTHTSGIQNYLLDPRFHAAAYFAATKDNISEKFFNTTSTDSLIKMFYTLPLEFSPGTTWSYSNTGYILLGKIAESVTAKPFFDLVREKLTSPLNMHHTKANEVAAKEGCLASGYLVKEGQLVRSPVLSSNYAFSAGAWATTGEDMVRYMKAIHQGTLLSDKAGYDWRYTPLNNELPFSYDGGKFFTTYHGSRVISHNGGTAGFSSSWINVPDKKISIIVLINRQDYPGIDQLAWDILSAYEPSLQYPTQTLNGKEQDKLSHDLIDMLNAVKTNAPYTAPLSKPLRMFMESENGKGLWKWYFERGFPTKAYCVDIEAAGDQKIFRFRLPLSKDYDYRLTLVQNTNKEWLQLRWW